MKKTMKIISAVLVAIMVLASATPIFATATATYITPSAMTGTAPTSTQIQEFGNKVIGVLTTAGIVLSVIILLVLGIKYMMGSAEEKAEYKKTMMPYLIGALLIFSASTIANIVYNFAKL